ncbi:hypothetical protein [Trichoplusia ni ascovirus 2c]|uniref:hypothetical protein n=1 Tax=Trichoplusia ni ascovirus 2c TaxID=328615 RepID=UPI0000E441E8|nr:hypothetical protein TNAV2c_gp016 [Trichoplusia ni ascovirus 2c]ABF70533.1 hypothetical protein [Trichoplusia ni ascovirus 2c]
MYFENINREITKCTYKYNESKYTLIAGNMNCVELNDGGLYVTPDFKTTKNYSDKSSDDDDDDDM